jgi:hypothetical protein
VIDETDPFSAEEQDDAVRSDVGEPVAATSGTSAETTEETEVVGAPVDVVEEPVARRIPTDEEVQAELEKIALGLKVRVRSTNGGVTDTFIVGGDYAPGRQRWVQTNAFDSAAKQAADLAASLQ